MGQDATKRALPPSAERVELNGTFRGKYRGFAVILVCCALLLAGFAISTIALQANGNMQFWNPDFWGNTPPKDEEQPSDEQNREEATTTADKVENEKKPLPEGAVAILSSDLSHRERGRLYIQNETLYAPDVEALLALSLTYSAPTEEPLVLILHTHSREAYAEAGQSYFEGALGDAVYSDDEGRSVLAVGETLARQLQSHGIGSVHCRVVHDSPTLGGAYDRSAETVRAYLAQYPSIRYVIDLHRDAVTGSGGEMIRAVWEADGEAVAQVMAVVGTDGNGTIFPEWERNLAFALQLREQLNAGDRGVCRPVFLRNASFHQELAPCSILLEIGTAGNSVDEAKRAAKLVGDALANLIYE